MNISKLFSHCTRLQKITFLRYTMQTSILLKPIFLLSVPAGIIGFLIYRPSIFKCSWLHKVSHSTVSYCKIPTLPLKHFSSLQYHRTSPPSSIKMFKIKKVSTFLSPVFPFSRSACGGFAILGRRPGTSRAPIATFLLISTKLNCN